MLLHLGTRVACGSADRLAHGAKRGREFVTVPSFEVDISMWQAAEPFLKDGLRTELGPESYYAADYCAYPVASVEAESVRGTINEGLRPAYVPSEE